jgi:putative salt-induced outer membrane protein
MKNSILANSLTIGTLAMGLNSVSINGQDAKPAEEPAKPKWSRSAFLGATITAGNSDSVLVTANVLAERKGGPNEYSLGLDGAYGELDSEKNVETLHGFAQYNRLFTERFYGYARVDGLHDAIADVEYRFTLGPGVGYYLIKTKDDEKKTATSLNVEGGPAFITEKVGRDENNYFALRVAEKFEHKFSDTARVWEMVEFLPQIDDWNNFIINGEVGVEATLTSKLLVRLVVSDTYDNEPAPDRKKNDVKVVSSIGYKF